MRIDQLLVQRGLASTRSQAQRLIAGGVQWRQGDVWRQVAITVGAVREVLLKTPGNFINRICCGVKLLRFGDVWCVDVDGTYTHDDPATLDEVRRDGDCYVIGGTVEAIELD